MCINCSSYIYPWYSFSLACWICCMCLVGSFFSLFFLSIFVVQYFLPMSITELIIFHHLKITWFTIFCIKKMCLWIDNPLVISFIFWQIKHVSSTFLRSTARPPIPCCTVSFFFRWMAVLLVAANTKRQWTIRSDGSKNINYNERDYSTYKFTND